MGRQTYQIMKIREVLTFKTPFTQAYALNKTSELWKKYRIKETPLVRPSRKRKNFPKYFFKETVRQTADKFTYVQSILQSLISDPRDRGRVGREDRRKKTFFVT